MEVRIQSIHFDASEQLQSFVQKKVAKLEKYFEGIKLVEVSLKLVKPETTENKEAGIKVVIPNGDLYANKISDTFEASIDEAIDALSKQLLKYKEKQRGI
ncbi:MAG: ribosome-associated translation inhibitor RaiA [Bacteroides sp.]